MSIQAYDVPPSDGLQGQRKEFFIRKILDVLPELEGTPELAYGDIELKYFRLVNDGVIDQTIADKVQIEVLSAVTSYSPAVDAIKSHVDDEATLVVPSLVAESIASDPMPAQAAAAAIDAEPRIADILSKLNPLDLDAMRKGGVLANGSDFNLLRGPSKNYTVTSSATAGTMLNIPANRAGNLLVLKNDAASATTQIYVAMVSTTTPSEIYIRSTITSNAAAGTAWSPWDRLNSAPKLLPDGTNLDTFRSPGTYIITSLNSAQTMTGLPSNGIGSGRLRIDAATGSGKAVATLSVEVDGTIRVFDRHTGLTGSWPNPWVWINPPAPTLPDTETALLPYSAHKHEFLLDQFIQRKTGKIRTEVGVVALRFDHWLVLFRDQILPILDKYDLPATLNINSDNWTIAANNGVTYEEVQNWSLYHGIDIANHGATHTGSTDPAIIIDEIIGGRDRLQAQLPKLVIDEWHMPGLAVPYDGFGNGNNVEVWLNTLAGKAIMEAHALASAYMGGFWHILDGRVTQGLMPQGSDGSTATELIEDVKRIQANKRGMVFLLHPNFITVEGGLDIAGFDTFCAFLATERDAGRLKVLTTAGEAVASLEPGENVNLFQNPTWGSDYLGDASTFVNWTGTAGYSVANPGTKNAVVTSTDTAALLTQSILMHSRFGWAEGGTFQMVAEVEAIGTNSIFRFSLEELGAPQNYLTTKDYPITAGTGYKTVRKNVTIPRIGVLTQMTAKLGRVSGGALRIKNLRFEAV